MNLQERWWNDHPERRRRCKWSVVTVVCRTSKKRSRFEVTKRVTPSVTAPGDTNLTGATF